MVRSSGRAHITEMPRTRSDTLDLFEYSPPATAPTRALMARGEHHLPALSDREIVALLGEVVQEVERRIGSKRGSPALSRALEETEAALRRLSRVNSRERRAARGAAAPLLHPAKHFGLSLTEVRKALAEVE